MQFTYLLFYAEWINVAIRNIPVEESVRILSKNTNEIARTKQPKYKQLPTFYPTHHEHEKLPQVITRNGERNRRRDT